MFTDWRLWFRGKRPIQGKISIDTDIWGTPENWPSWSAALRLILTVSSPYHRASSPSAALTIGLPHPQQSLPSGFLTLSSHYHRASSPSAVLTIGLPHRQQSLPSGFLTLSSPYHRASSPSAVLTIGLPQTWAVKTAGGALLPGSSRVLCLLKTAVTIASPMWLKGFSKILESCGCVCFVIVCFI